MLLNLCAYLINNQLDLFQILHFIRIYNFSAAFSKATVREAQIKLLAPVFAAHWDIPPADAPAVAAFTTPVPTVLEIALPTTFAPTAAPKSERLKSSNVPFSVLNSGSSIE